MADTFRAVFKEMVHWIDDETHTSRGQDSLVIRARALLAQPEPEGLTDKELLGVFLIATAADMERQGGLTASDMNGIAKQFEAQTLAGLRAVIAADRAHHPTPQPVAVSERLPGPKDVNEDGEVWIIEEGYSYALGDTGDYDWEPHKIVLRPIGQFDEKYGRTWLPANALPTPQGEEATL